MKKQREDNNTARYPSLRDKVVVISGGADGIGADIARAFATQQAKVLLLDIAADKGRALAGSLGGQFYHCDVTDIARLQEVFTQVAEEHDGVDVLINNAGDDQHHSFSGLTESAFDECINVNLRHHVFAIQSVSASMAKKGQGVIINLGSIIWRRGKPGRIGYSISKAAIHGLTRALAHELGEQGIRINSLVPGAIKTDKQQAMWQQLDPEAEQRFLDQQALKVRLDGQHCANMALFLASDESSGCTGQDFIVDAGLSIN